MSALEIKISKEFDGVCIREYLKEQLDLSSRLIRSAAREQRILVNGKAVTMRYTLFENDNSFLYISPAASTIFTA